MTPPLLPSQALQTASTNIILVSFPVLVGKVCQLHRFKGSVNDHRRAKPGTEPQEKHTASFIASERLHGSVIDDPSGTPECLAKIKSDPTATEIVGLMQNLSVDHGPGISDRYDVIIPVLSRALHILNHPLRRHGWARGNLDLFALFGGQHLDVCATNVDYENLLIFPGGSHRGFCLRLR